MNVIIIIDWSSVLTDSNIIQSGWERTNSTLTEDMKRQMFDTIDSNIQQLKERLHIPLSECIKGECTIPFEKECLDDVVDMCVHHEGTHGGLVLYITTKVRELSKQAIRKKIQVTSIPSRNNKIDTTTDTQQHSNAPTTTIQHTLQQEDIQTTTRKKRSSNTINSCTSSNEKVKNHRKKTKNNNSDNSSHSSAESSAVKKKTTETIPVSNKTTTQNDNFPNSVSVQERHNQLRRTTENTTPDPYGNDVDDDDNGTTTNIRTDVTDLVKGL